MRTQGQGEPPQYSCFEDGSSNKLIIQLGRFSLSLCSHKSHKYITVQNFITASKHYLRSNKLPSMWHMLSTHGELCKVDKQDQSIRRTSSPTVLYTTIDVSFYFPLPKDKAIMLHSVNVNHLRGTVGSDFVFNSGEIYSIPGWGKDV